MDFRKTGSASQIAHEAAGLHWLADSGRHSIAIVPVLEVGPTWLIEPRLRSVSPSRHDAEDFGAALAHLHAAGAPSFGAAPPRAPDSRGWIGRARLSLNTGEESWGCFYARQRIRPYLDAPFSRWERRILLDLCELLESGELDHPQPAMVTSPAARIHGDLWSGNVMWTESGPVLIDPAAHGGHAEDDLGALSLFGTPYLSEILSSYNRASALAAGWEDRLELHQMHLLMVHSQLFAGGYLGQTVEVAARILRKGHN